MAKRALVICPTLMLLAFSLVGCKIAELEFKAKDVYVDPTGSMPSKPLTILPAALK